MAKEHGKLSDAQFQERVRQTRRRLEAQRVEDLQHVMRTDSGKRFVYSLAFERGKLHGPSFHGHQKDGLSNALCSAHVEGRRGLASELIDDVKKHCLPEFLEMMGTQIKERAEALMLEQHAAASEGQDDAS